MITVTEKTDRKARTSITIDPDIWDAAKKCGKENKLNFSEVVEQALKHYIKLFPVEEVPND